MRSLSCYVVARRTTLLSYVGLLLVLLFGCLGITTLDENWIKDLSAKVVLWLLFSSGLLLVAPGIIREKKRSHQWLCFILLIYFIWAVQALLAQPVDTSIQPPDKTVEAAALIFIVLCFIAAMMTVRWADQRQDLP